MEVQFETNKCRCVKGILHREQCREETQELRIGEDMPPIGQILGCWGQVLIRSKEWRSGNIGVSGGVMAWALYRPEQGGTPEPVSCWIPFQLKWDIPDETEEGNIYLTCCLQNIDARALSSGKMLLRAVISVTAHICTSTDAQWYSPADPPESLQLLNRTYPVSMPRETGEKAFHLEETLKLPESSAPVKKIVRLSVCPRIEEQRVMTDKLVFRGSGKLHLLYLSTEDALCAVDLTLPFSQYAPLEQEYSDQAGGQLYLLCSDLEADPEENSSIHVKIGLVAQYLICDTVEIGVVADAYSPACMVEPELARLQIPSVLDVRRDSVEMQQELEEDVGRMIDLTFSPGPVTAEREGDKRRLNLSGRIHSLYYDTKGEVQCTVSKWNDKKEITAEETCALSGVLEEWEGLRFSGSGQVNGSLELSTMCYTDTEIPAVCSLTIGEEKQKDPQRPSLIVRRCGNATVWDLAKSTGTTVASILQLNHLEGEPDENQMLLIPVE